MTDTDRKTTERAKLDPRSLYASPQEVLDDAALSHAQKAAILRQWEYDARELQTAEDENMAGGEPSRLTEVRRALDRLGAET
jgi:hypothetical protein